MDVSFINSESSNCDYYDSDEKWFTTLKKERKPFMLGHLNIRSVPLHFDNMCASLRSTVENIDLLALTETFLTEEKVRTNNFNLTNYQMIEKHRVGGRQGGILCYVKKKYRVEEEDANLCECENLYLKVYSENECVMNVIIIYRPPRSNIKDFNASLDNFLSETKEKNLVLLGDINIDLMKAETEQVSREYLNMLNSHGMISLVNKPTREEMLGNSLVTSALDHIIVRQMRNFNFKSGIVTCKISDHYLVLAAISKPNMKQDKQKGKSKFIDIVHSGKFKTEVCGAVKEVVFEENSGVEDRYSKLLDAIDLAKQRATIAVRRKHHITPNKPWMTDAILELIKERDLLFRKWKNARPQCRENARLNYTKIRNKVQKDITVAKNNYYESKFREFKMDIKSTWALVNEISGKQKPKTVDETIEKYFLDNHSAVEIGNQFVDTIIDEVERKTHKCNKSLFKQQNNKVSNSMVLLDATEPSINKIVKYKLNKNVSPGLDNVTVKQITENSEIFVPVLTSLTNASINQAVVPTKMKKSLLRPVYKKGSHKQIENYRPIAISSSIPKIVEIYVAEKLDSFLEANNIIIKEQYGYRKGKGAIDLLEDFCDNLNRALDNHMQVVVCFVDFTKAFDSLNHQKLLDVLEDMGIRGTVNNWIRDYLKNRKYVVKIKEELSKERVMVRGVPQGSVLGPKLYTCYVNDIGNCFKDCEFYMFADDLAIVSKHMSQKVAVENLQREFNNFMLWAHDKELTINTSKTEVMHITSPNVQKLGLVKIISHNLDCLHELAFSEQNKCKCETYLKQVKVFRYLGVYIDENLNWTSHIDMLCKKLSLCAMRLNNLKWFTPSNIMLQIYYGLVVSILNYGIGAWGLASDTNINRIQNLQNKCVKAVFYKSGTAKIEDIYQRLQILKVKQMVNFRLVNKFRNSIELIKIDNHNYGTRNQKSIQFKIPETYNKYGNRTFKVLIPKILNALPEDIREISSSYRFKKKVKLWMIEN